MEWMNTISTSAIDAAISLKSRYFCCWLLFLLFSISFVTTQKVLLIIMTWYWAGDSNKKGAQQDRWIKYDNDISNSFSNN